LIYIKGTPGKGLLYKEHGHLCIETYSDSGYAGTKKTKFTSGYCIYVGGNLVIWRSIKQNVVSQANVEAKYKGMTHIL